MNNTASTGWELIEREFLRIYPGQNNPLHFAAMIKWRFGGKLSPDGAVEDLSVGNSHTVSFKPSQLSSDIYHVLVCFSVYGDDEKMNFSKIKNPATVIDLFGFGGSGEFKLELSSEKTVEVVEFYRHNDRIKMKTIGSGYFTGIEKLCEKLGIETQ